MMDAENQRANLESFGKLVLADLELHNRLRTAAVEAFPELAVKLGAERGYKFTVEAVREELQKKRRALCEKWI
jgi:Nif11 domain